jgi:hypothetical protein
VQCWPDNWQALQVFSALSTQWNVGMSGAVGMRYEAFSIIFEAFSIKKKARAELMYLLRIMENEALQVFRENG